eukprot:Platyproteum_vivax@DN7801_c0_g1_i1.p1
MVSSPQLFNLSGARYRAPLLFFTSRPSLVGKSDVFQSFHEGDTKIDPFSRYQWLATPFKKCNMPREDPYAPKHYSLISRTVMKTDRGAHHVIDVKGMYVGYVARYVCRLLRGNWKVNYNMNQLTDSDHVVVVNAVHLKLPGHTWDTKVYRLKRKTWAVPTKAITAKHIMSHNPGKILAIAVNGMLPKNKLREVYMRKLFIYNGALHPHTNLPQVVVPAPAAVPPNFR